MSIEQYLILSCPMQGLILVDQESITNFFRGKNHLTIILYL
jgi:hypothetical protein